MNDPFEGLDGDNDDVVTVKAWTVTMWIVDDPHLKALDGDNVTVQDVDDRHLKAWTVTMRIVHILIVSRPGR